MRIRDLGFGMERIRIRDGKKIPDSGETSRICNTGQYTEVKEREKGQEGSYSACVGWSNVGGEVLILLKNF
jgi:hypothetical protein